MAFIHFTKLLLGVVARRLEVFLSLNWLLPRRIKDLLKPLFRKKIAVDVEWTPELKRFAIDAIRPDAERFLEVNGKPRDFWSWE